jgi:phage-related minor tail protein
VLGFFRLMPCQYPGISADVYGPKLAQLRALKLEQQALAASSAASSNSIAHSITPTVDHLGMSAKATAAALRGVPAQLTNIVVSLQGGQAPLTVLLQQGGQLKDMFGGIGNASKALGVRPGPG